MVQPQNPVESIDLAVEVLGLDDEVIYFYVRCWIVFSPFPFLKPIIQCLFPAQKKLLIKIL